MTSLTQHIATAMSLLDEDRPAVWPKPIDLAELAKKRPEPPKFLIPEWLPAGYATLFAGHGGAGKSAIALQVAAALATGGSFAGLQAEHRRVLFLSCEDRVEVLHWRLERLCAHLGVSLADLRDDLRILDLVNYDTALWTPNTIEHGSKTAAYEDLFLTVIGEGVEVIIIDGISDTFGGDEVRRAQVRAFISSLTRLVPSDTGAVLLLGHVDKAGAGNGKSHGFSGSTAWHNSVRARWYLAPETSDDPDSDMLLELRKSNHGGAGRQIRFTWDSNADMFVGRAVRPETPLDVAARERTERGAILSAMQAVIDAGDYIPAANVGQRTALHVLSQRPEFPTSIDPEDKADRRRFWRLVEGLRAMGGVREDTIARADRHRVRTLVPVTQAQQGERACGQ